MNKIITLHKNNIRFTIKAIIIDLYKDKQQNLIKKKHAIIILQNSENGKEVVHPITDFIFTYWKHKEYNTMSSAAYQTVAFLNWIFFEGENKVTDLSELQISHAVQFLFNLTYKGNQKSTVQKYEKTIQQLYVYLFQKGIIQHIPYIEIENMNKTAFQGLIYNPNSKGTRLHDFKTELIIPFIELAYYERNQIALGVYYQIFGGLRSGEVVNVRKSNIRNVGAYGEFGQILKLQNAYLREDIVSTSGKGEVKKNREQVIFPYKSLLKKLYKEHTEKYSSEDNPDALFINRNGKAMTGDDYNYHFNVLKEKFIKQLTNSEDIRLKTYGKYLESMNWSTHIGRGLFSNLMAEYTDNVLEIAVSRGDSNLSSSLTYMADTQRIVQKLQDELELLYTGDFLS